MSRFKICFSLLVSLTLAGISWPGPAPKCSATQNSLAFYLGCYESEFKRYPPTLEALSKVADRKIPLATLYACPVSHQHYAYAVSSDGKSFQLKCHTKGHPSTVGPKAH